MESAVPTLTRRLGRFEVVGRLALGGMAEILLARLRGPSGFDRPVVLKRILPHLRDAQFTRMLLEEGALSARIRHPNVAQVQELCDDDDELYLVIEYLEGEAAAGLARRLRARAMRLPPALVAYIGAEACAGLHAAHELTGPDGAALEIVHRDVSPQNVFVSYDGTVKILDFGIAKAASGPARTEVGVLKGKVEYMSPEQARGEPLDRRADLFALGVVLYELAVQHHLFRRPSTVEAIMAVCDAPIPPPRALAPELPASLERVLLRALDRDPSRRYATALEMRRELLGVVRELGEELPEQSLCTLMESLFADRIAEKRAMLRELGAGAPVPNVPAAEVDIEVELPTVFAGSKSDVRTRALHPAARDALPEPRRRSVALPLLAALGMLALAAVGGWLALRPRPPAGSPVSEPVAARSAMPQASATPAPVQPAATPDEVDVSVESEPAGARVVVSGAARGTTPVTFRLPRASTPLAISVERDGFETVEESIVPDVAQRLRVTLDRVGTRARPRQRRIEREVPPGVAPPPVTPAAGTPREFRRFH